MATSGKKEKRNNHISEKPRYPFPTKQRNQANCYPSDLSLHQFTHLALLNSTTTSCKRGKKKRNHQPKPNVPFPTGHPNPTTCYSSDFKFQHFTHLMLPTSNGCFRRKREKKQNHISKTPRYLSNKAAESGQLLPFRPQLAPIHSPCT